MSTVRKYDGYVTDILEKQWDWYNVAHMFKDKSLHGKTPAVLIVSSDGQPPMYFTQEEVKAMLEQAEMVARTMGSMFLDEAEARELATADFNTLKAKHGITDL